MINTGSRKLNSARLLVIVFVSASLFLALLLSTTRSKVFFSGDGGLKYLSIQPFNKPGNFTALHLPADSWVSNIWNQGFYPFKPPFVYDSGWEHTLSFPPFFQLLTNPLYRFFGYGGLYIVPALSLVFLWGWFIRLLYQLRVRVAVILLAFGCLAFCSPLTIYGAIYWEHTLAVLLLFGGTVFLVHPTGKPLIATAWGGMAGLAAWLRPEALLLCLLIAATVLYNQRRNSNKASIYFITSVFAVIAQFLLINRLLYGDVLGAHAYQLFNNATFAQKLHQHLQLLVHLNARQALYFPAMPVICILVAYKRIKKAAMPPAVLQLLLIAVLFSLIAPFFLPNAGGKQWGPRYFLFLIPIVLVAAALYAHTFIKDAVAVTWWLLTPVLLYSLYLNSYKAFSSLHDDYAYRVRPCLQYVEHDPCRVVVVQNQFIAQEFSQLFLTKQIFLAENQQQYTKLLALLKTAPVTEIIFIAKNKEQLLACSSRQINTQGFRHIGDYFLTRCSW